MNIDYWMQGAIGIAKEGQSPFGALILDENLNVVAQSANTGRKTGPLHHAEMNVLLEASDIHGKLENHILVTTCEPCPMCAGAAIWARISAVYFGFSIDQISAYVSQIHVDMKEITRKSFHKPAIYHVPGYTDQIGALFQNRLA